MKGVYLIRHIPTDRCYVGSSISIERRWREHRRLMKSGTHPSKHLMHAYRLYGPREFEFRVLEECDVSMEAIRIERENHWIQTLNPCFNVAPVAGSVLGLRRSKEVRARMSAAQKGRVSPLRGVPRPDHVRAAISASKKGRVMSPESIAKMAESLRGKVGPNKGKHLSAEVRAKISASKTGIPRDPEAVRKTAESLRGKTRSIAQRMRISESQKGRVFSLDHKEKLSLAAKARWAGTRTATL